MFRGSLIVDASCISEAHLLCTSVVPFALKVYGVKAIPFETVSDNAEVSVWCTELVENVRLQACSRLS